MLPRLLRRATSHRGIAAAAGVAAAGAAWAAPSLCERPPPAAPPVAPSDLPIYSKAEVAKHKTAENGIWVIFQGNVYDITQFVENHPGGIEKIMTAAGGDVEPYWSLYRQHLKPASGGAFDPKEHVGEILQPLLIGHIDPAEVAAAKKNAKPADDPYAHEPERHGALRLISETPCSGAPGETPQTLVYDNWLTPNALFFVRNHHPVPRLDPQAYTLQVEGLGVRSKEYSLAELKALPKAEVVATLQCGGNRRGGLDEVKRTSGNPWGCGAISNAKWGGVYLRDVLRACGLDRPLQAGVAHVQFEGEDGTKASIPAMKAFSEYGDVLLAYEMNDEPLPPDHGFPVRAVVPGHVGVRNIKWLRRIVASDEEAEGVWQRGIAYKSFGPNVTSLEGIGPEGVAKAPPMQEMPVQSVIVSPTPLATVEPGELTLQGFAWSGGGRAIMRVECSADEGRSWHTATLQRGAEQPLERAWAWTFWECEVPLPSHPATSKPEVQAEKAEQASPGGGSAPQEGRLVSYKTRGTVPAAGVKPAQRVTLMCRAVDAAYNTQPPEAAQVWNLRGLANNAWHRVPVMLDE